MVRMVYEIRSHIMRILITGARRKETMQRDFRLLADRAMRILLEVALGSAPVKSIDFTTPSDTILQGLESICPSCGISIGEAGFPLLEAFRVIQPDSPTGITLPHLDLRCSIHYVLLSHRVCVRGSLC
jgi:uracil phosphoribosyltransferase